MVTSGFKVLIRKQAEMLELKPQNFRTLLLVSHWLYLILICSPKTLTGSSLPPVPFSQKRGGLLSCFLCVDALNIVWGRSIVTFGYTSLNASENNNKDFKVFYVLDKVCAKRQLNDIRVAVKDFQCHRGD